MKSLKSWMILAVLALASMAPNVLWADEDVCDVRGLSNPSGKLNDCREERRAIGGLDTFWFSPGDSPIDPQLVMGCTVASPHRACMPGEPGCSDEIYDFDELEWARHSCYVSNNKRKLDLRECVQDGITFKENDVDDACETKAKNIHRRTDGSPCELLNPVDELVDIGNSEFYTCEATGPGPADLDAASANSPGCCKLGSMYLSAEHWEAKKMQTMKFPFSGFYREWPEHYLDRYSPADLFACNPPDTEHDVKLTHHSCLMTPKDIMIEGFANAQANPEHRTPGWCDVTTGSGFEDADLPQIAKDIAKVVGWIASPKGILTPPDPNNYDTTDGDYGCFTQKKNFADHCSSLGTHTRDHLGFAHSMGAIVTASFDIPLQQFGGSVVGPGSGNSYRNNCDPVPWVARVGHKAAIAFVATHPIAGGAPGANGKIPHNYKICSEMAAAGKQPHNCINVNGTYIGRPEGPSDCYVNGETCKWAPWCGANPYVIPQQEYTGRDDYTPMECSNEPNEDLADKIKECFDFTGIPPVDVLSCVTSVFEAATLASDMIKDHLFDGSGEGDGYRPITGANWGEPRWRNYGTFFECPDGWVPETREDQDEPCCTLGAPDGAACQDDGDCCNGLTCNAGSCEAPADCPPDPMTGHPTIDCETVAF